MLKLMRKTLPREVVEKEVSQIREAIQSQVRPSEAYLIGSASSGEMTDQSDFDLLIVMPTEEDCRVAKKKFAACRDRLPKRPFDVLWYAQDYFDQQKITGGIAFIAFHEGKRLV